MLTEESNMPTLESKLLTHIITALPMVLMLAAYVLLQGCGGDSGEEVIQNENPRSEVTANYSGPVPANSEIQSFKLQFWDNLSPNNRCGSCHGDGQEPQFVRNDDINAAYDAVMGSNSSGTSYVNLSTPSESLLSTKVGGGHHCWEASNDVCADAIALYITRWAGDRAGGASETIVLVAPDEFDPGSSKNFPESSGIFNNLHTILKDNCSDCHVSSPVSRPPQSPFFAELDINIAYLAVQSKIDLETISNSRLVVRLEYEFHNCWSADCEDDADELEAEIAAMAGNIDTAEVDPALVISKAQLLSTGILSSSGGRFESNIIALYEFKEGEGQIAYDRSGIAPLLHLNLSDEVQWVQGWGITLTSGKAQGSTSDSAKLHDLITATGEYSIEAWVAPANVTQEGSYIISYSAGTTDRNFTLGQTLYNYDFLQRSSTTDANGEPAISTPDDDEDLQAVMQHVVATFGPEGRKLYVNGELINVVDTVDAGNLNDWNNSYAFVLGNEVSNDRQWQGTLKMVAIHNRVLTPGQILQNFEVGVGEKFYLLFGISDVVDIPESYIVFEVSLYDNYSYLFNTPFFISLSDTASPGGLQIQNMRIGINGREATVGQAYSRLNTTIDSTTYAADGRQTLSSMGTIIPVEKGAESDEFFLTFELLGNQQNVFVEAEFVAPTFSEDIDPVPPHTIGLRTFDEINASMAAVTGVDIKNSSIDFTFQTLKQQLPTKEDINGFLAAHQVGIAQLAIEYCVVLVDTISLRDAFFTNSSFSFANRSDTAFDTNPKKDSVIDDLREKIIGEDLAEQPSETDVHTELRSLIDILDECSGCSNSEYIERTSKVVKGVCAAVLGSAALLIQ